MPPQRADKNVHIEGQMLLAKEAIRKGQISSINKAAQLYSVPATTLRRRIKGRVARVDLRANGHKLTSIEEEAILKWILEMDDRGFPLTITGVRDAARIILQSRVGPTGKIGLNWPNRFINRNPTLRSQYTRSYDYQRAKCEDPVLIEGWFRLVRNTIAKYGIIDDDIYNFDETGFAMGLASSARVVTSCNRRRKPLQLQPGDREWVTVIEAISAKGWTTPPMIIVKGKRHISNWYENDLPRNWTIALSEKGWTNNELGVEWLSKIFEPSTASRTVGTHRLLILDGHSSHATPEFDQFCKDRLIVTLCMPPHSSHLLQPLDVGCFAVLKRAYSNEVIDLIRLGIHHIDKPEFLHCFKIAHNKALTQNNIASGFRATGLVPFEPEEVLATIHRPLTPPEPPTATQEQWQSETPRNLAQLEHQFALIKGLIRKRSKSPPSPTDRALNQLIKGCQMAMSSAVLLTSDNERLRTANERLTRTRQKKRRYISRNITLTVAEASELIQPSQVPRDNVNQGGGTGPPAPQIGPIEPTPPAITCYICRGFDHQASDCMKYR